jgi:hypothetical protein
MSDIEIPETLKVWKLGGKAGNIRSQNNYTDNSGYNLFCQSNNKYLTWKKVPAGINLDFINDAAVKKTHFRLPDGQERDILSGELLALGIGGGDPFLQYAHRTLGINLEWTKNPVFQWRIFAANGQAGIPIAADSLLAIANIKVQPSPDFMIYCDRPPGMADVGWTTTPQFWNKFGNAAIELARKNLGL